jgi:hypothetical protein
MSLMITVVIFHILTLYTFQIKEIDTSLSVHFTPANLPLRAASSFLGKSA